MTTRAAVRFPTTILLIGVGHGLLTAVLAGLNGQSESGIPFGTELLFALGILVWALSVLFWHGLALVSWRYQWPILLAVLLPSLITALVVGYLNETFLQMVCTQTGLIGSAVVTGLLTKKQQSRIKAWLCGATVSVLATCIWMGVDYDAIVRQVIPPADTASSVSEKPSASNPSSTMTTEPVVTAADSQGVLGIDLEAVFKRLLPSSLLVSELAPVAVGGVLFARSASSLQGELAALPLLRVPFAIMPVLTVAIAARLWLNEPAVQIADNLLLVLALLYLLGGIAMVSFLMRHFQLPFALRLGCWLLALLFSPYLFPLLILGGLFDSFLDFRARLVIPPAPLS